MQTWAEIRTWRQDQRDALIRARLQSARADRKALVEGLRRQIEALNLSIRGQAISLYWPIKGEPSMMQLAVDWQQAGAILALPVVVERNAALEFWRWQPGDAMNKGLWNIPVPARRDPIEPDLLLVPLVGFDGECHRLGYGGGYYDRTLARLPPQALCIGVGPQSSRLASIHPQAHDRPMDIIVTEAGAWRRTSAVRDPDPAIELASPPCFRHELDPDI